MDREWPEAFKISPGIALTIYKKIIFGQILANGNRGTSVISQMEDPSFDTQPVTWLATESEAQEQKNRYRPSKVSRQSYGYMARMESEKASQVSRPFGSTNVFPLAGKPTVMITIRPE